MTSSFDMLDGRDPAAEFRIAVGIATMGRRDILSDALRLLDLQTRRPDMVFVCPADAEDVDPCVLSTLQCRTQIVQGGRGSCVQRNAIIDVARGFDLIAFLDDDFFAHSRYFEAMAQCFCSQTEIVAVSGLVILDGVSGSGVSVKDAQEALESHRYAENGKLISLHNAYGCNMCFRLTPVHTYNIRFDENLPLYGWLEDVDFSRQIARFGKVMKNRSMVGVHLGTKLGRTSGVRFGYSQIANPIYIWRKGSTTLAWSLRQISRNVMANLRGLLRREPWIDRPGRMSGNLRAIWDLLFGRINPNNILRLEKGDLRRLP